MMFFIEKKRMIRAHGFSLIELMIIVSVIGVMSALAFPTFTQWVKDAKTRTAAEALQNGIRLAQAEAVKRGRQVQFVLTDDAPNKLNPQSSTSGKNWVIRSMTLENASIADEFIEGANLRDDSGTVQIMLNNKDGVITFNSIGRLVNPAAAVIYSLTNGAKPSRSLNVTVSLSGGIRMCDPDKSRANSPDGCT